MDDYEKGMPKCMNLHYHEWGLSHESDVDTKRGCVYKSFTETVKELGATLNISADSC